MRYLVLLLFLTILNNCGDAKAMKIDKPSYYLKLYMADCPRGVSVNGIELEQDLAGNTSYSEFPINHYIKHGENSIELLVGEKDFMLESTNENSQCKVEIRVRGKSNDKNVDYKVTDIVYTPNYTDRKEDLYALSMPTGDYQFSDSNTITKVEENGDFSIDDITRGPVYFNGADHTFERKFTVVVPFEKWSFFEAEQVFKTPIESDEAYYKAKKIVAPLRDDLIKLLATQDTNKILPAFELRSNEIDLAFYKEPGTTQNELKVSLENIFKNDYPFIERKDNDLQMAVSYDGRLVTLVNGANMDGTVHYQKPGSNTYIFYTVYWAKKDGRWYIAR